MTRGDLTDDEWAVFEPMLPLGERGPVPDLRRLATARSEVFQTLKEAVIAEAAAHGQADLGLVSVDSIVARARHHAAGMTVDAELLETRPGSAPPNRGAHAAG